MDRNAIAIFFSAQRGKSLSARRAWIEIGQCRVYIVMQRVALRKESVDRNALGVDIRIIDFVALRKESVDRNRVGTLQRITHATSLSARRAWIEILIYNQQMVERVGRSPQGERG